MSLILPAKDMNPFGSGNLGVPCHGTGSDRVTGGVARTDLQIKSAFRWQY